MLLNKCVDVIAITESWLKPKHTNKQVEIDGYNIFRNDRIGLGGGGVALFVKKNIKCKIISASPSKFSTNLVEFLNCELLQNEIKYLISVVYRRPERVLKLDNFFSEYHRHLTQYDNRIVLGDFNLNFVHINDKHVKEALTAFDDVNLSRLPIQNTHRASTSITTIDAIFVTPSINRNNFGKFVNNLSHHETLYLIINAQRSNSLEEMKFIREFEKVNKNELTGQAFQIDWHMCNENWSIDDKVELFTKMLLEFYDEYLPLKEIKSSKIFKPKLSSEINELIAHREKLRKLAYKATNLGLFEKYKEVKNRVKQQIVTYHKKIIFDKLNSLQNSVHIWNKLRNLGLVKAKNVPTNFPVSLNEMIKGLTVTQDADRIAKINQEYEVEAELSGEKLYFQHVNPVKVKNAVFSITTSAEGNDRVCIKMLKFILNPILPSLTNIINTSLQTSSFPTSWKKSLICPIPKVNYPTAAGEYRPISILCTMSKILEKIAYDQILTFVNAENILDPLQSGFRKKFSTGTALLRISEDIKSAFHKKEVVLMVFLDFSKAFDTVNHELLINKLKQLNFSDPVLKWLESYLSERTQAVRDNKRNVSDWQKVECGVPQGSPLSALLYSLYGFDICKIFRNRCKHHVYADDTQLYIICPPDELSIAIQIMNFVLEDVFNWSESHGLKLNPSKTQAMILTPQNTHISTENLPELVLCNTKIDYFEHVKNLGVMFDQKLSWNKQISHICQKVYGTLNNLEKFRDVTPEKIRLQLVKSLILPHFDYCSYVYCDINKEQFGRLQNALNSAIYYVYNVPFAASLSPYYKQAGILKVQDQNKINVLCMTHKILYGNAPSYLSDLVTKASDVNQRTMRSHKMKLRAPLAGVKVPVSSFKVVCYRLWDSVPQNVCLINSVDAFKNQIKQQFLNSYD